MKKHIKLGIIALSLIVLLPAVCYASGESAFTLLFTGNLKEKIKAQYQ